MRNHAPFISRRTWDTLPGKYSGDEVPLYATLSHTWGPKGSEVTYEDIVKSTAAEWKTGYASRNVTRTDNSLQKWMDLPP